MRWHFRYGYAEFFEMAAEIVQSSLLRRSHSDEHDPMFFICNDFPWQAGALATPVGAVYHINPSLKCDGAL